MKYPQLVPTRAVNAISDWLVTRLEQLGVESPHIYTRLLLSLLQTTVQINDPNEFNNLETYLANRKGSNRRYLAFDTDTLKKLNAVQCLQDIVSQEQDISVIENLVDELCEKLKEIEEQQNTDNVQEDNELATKADSKQQQQQQVSEQQQQEYQHLYNCIKQHHKQQQQRHLEKSDANAAATAQTDVGASVETDPKKRYFRAFPALTKEMEDSFRLWRRNAKSLTWPVERANLTLLQTSKNHQQQQTTATTAGGGSDNNSRNRRITATATTTATITTTTTTTTRTTTSLYLRADKLAAARELFATTTDAAAYDSGNNATAGGIASGGAGGGGVKRKSKRRRNQALPKGKTSQNLRKNSIGNGAVITGGRSAGIGGGVGLPSSGGGGGGRYQRRSSPPYWDTDFEGCWEMGPDLIKEFLMKQNNAHQQKQQQQQRNRSTSESAAYNMLLLQHDDDDEEEDTNETEESDEIQASERNLPEDTTDASSNSAYLPLLEDFVEHVVTNSSPPPPPQLTDDVNVSVGAARGRLYQRDAHLISPKALKPVEMLQLMQQKSAQAAQYNAPADVEASSDFAQFKAKFNSSIEALWKNVDEQQQQPYELQQQQQHQEQQKFVLLNNVTAPAVVVAPFKENLRNFWTNYFNNQQQQQHSATDGNGFYGAIDDQQRVSMSLSCSISSHANDLTQTSDYYSMPNHFDDFDKSVGGRSSNGASSNVFLQNSIWSNNSQNSPGDTDESFYYKVWNSNKKLDAMHGVKLGNYGLEQLQQKQPEDSACFVLPPYHASSKWSEGINAGPHLLPQQQHPHHPQQHFLQPPTNQLRLLIDNTNLHHHHHHHHHASSLCTNTTTDYTDSSTTVSLSSSWQTPVASNSACNQLACQNLQPDLQSWSASNPMSLTEMYESSIDTVDTNNLKMLLSAGESTLNGSTNAINLPNHSLHGSGFVEYARVKSMLRPRSHELFMQRQQYIAQLMLRPRERFPENENLLTSQRTHFNPINSFIDGHSFEISSSLDVIEYERSPSGSRYLDADKYVEYTRNDSLLGEDDITEGADMSATASNTPLYATSNCAAATARKAAVKENFIIRFAMRNCEVACQTEDNIEQQTMLNVLTFEQQFACQQLAKSELMARRRHQQQYPMYMIFANNLAMQQQQQGMHVGGNLMQHTSNTLACNDAIQALNKAVAAAATAASLGNANVWVPNATMGCDMDNYRASQLIMRSAGIQEQGQGQGIWQRNRAQHLMNDANNQELDELDCNRQQQQQQQWSMHEIGKQCMLKGHQQQQQSMGNDINSTRINDDSDNNNCIDDERHSLWSMCAACNNEYKSVPANRMLRDELQLEADEIMSDLKYMQDLYIGQRAASSLDAQSDATTQCADDLMECNKNSVGNVSDWRLLGGDYGYDDEPMHVPAHNAFADETHTVIEKVNRLIVDLLCPADGQQQSDAQTPDDDEVLWYSSSSNNNKQNVNSTNIWQELEHKDVLIKPIDLIRHFTNEPLNENAEAEHRQLQWEHSNLADIWRKTDDATNTPAHNNQATVEAQEQNLETDAGEEKFPIVEALRADEQRDTAALSFQPPNVSSNAFKRIQQFLNANASNNSAAKLKLANRKRRHSASQNYFNHTMALNMGLHWEKNNNNNSIDVADLNCFNLKLKNLAKRFEGNRNKAANNEEGTQTTQEEEAAAGEEDILMEHQQQQHERNIDHDETLPNQTYITCKYWTTLEPTTNLLDITSTAARTTTLIGNDELINDTNDVIGTGIDTIDGNTFSCLIDKNARILKHVTMLTRPLTR